MPSPPAEPVPPETSQAKPSLEVEPGEPELLGNEEWARTWAGSFVQEQLREAPDIDAVGLFRIVVNELVVNSDLVRQQSFDLIIELTESITRQAARKIESGSGSKGLIRRRMG